MPNASTATGQGDQPHHIQLIQMAVAIWTARAVYAAAELGLADIIDGGTLSVKELAQLTETDPGALRRLLRALASRGVFTEAAPGRFALTELGAALKSDAPGAARATLLTLGGQWQWGAWGNFLYSLQTGKPGLERSSGLPLFEYLTKNLRDGVRFNEAMVGMYGAVGHAVVQAYDFSEFDTIADIGGGTGKLLTTILQAALRARGLLFDLPEVLPQARRSIDAAGLNARCELAGGNFFESIPTGYDVYLLAHVLHDWTDEQALPLLKNCRKAISANGRLLIIEAVLPAGDVPHHGKLMDLLMLTVTGGMERSEQEFGSLLAAAGFRLNRVVPTATHQSILEAVAA
jgi:ubiquinone/menaquinone biosynthesis C-methylase UbiE